MSKAFYRHPLSALGTFTYHDWEGDGTIAHVADHDGQRYYVVDDTVPLPTSEVATFEAVTLTDDLAATLRSVAMPDVLSWVKSDNEVLQEKLAAINAQRDADLDAGVKFNGKTFHSDSGFLTELLGLVLGYQAGLLTGKSNIRTLDNETVQMDDTAVTGLAKAVGDGRQAVYAKAWAAKDSLRNSMKG